MMEDEVDDILAELDGYETNSQTHIAGENQQIRVQQKGTSALQSALQQVHCQIHFCTMVTLIRNC